MSLLFESFNVILLHVYMIFHHRFMVTAEFLKYVYVALVVCRLGWCASLLSHGWRFHTHVCAHSTRAAPIIVGSSTGFSWKVVTNLVSRANGKVSVLLLAMMNDSLYCVKGFNWISSEPDIVDTTNTNYYNLGCVAVCRATRMSSQLEIPIRKKRWDVVCDDRVGRTFVSCLSSLI